MVVTRRLIVRSSTESSSAISLWVLPESNSSNSSTWSGASIEFNSFTRSATSCDSGVACWNSRSSIWSNAFRSQPAPRFAVDARSNDRESLRRANIASRFQTDSVLSICNRLWEAELVFLKKLPIADCTTSSGSIEPRCPRLSRLATSAINRNRYRSINTAAASWDPVRHFAMSSWPDRLAKVISEFSATLLSALIARISFPPCPRSFHQF